MPAYTISGIDGNAEVEINRIVPTLALLRGGYQIRITSHDPKPARTAITIDHDGFAELLYRLLSDDDSLQKDLRQRLFNP